MVLPRLQLWSLTLIHPHTRALPRTRPHPCAHAQSQPLTCAHTPSSHAPAPAHAHTHTHAHARFPRSSGHCSRLVSAGCSLAAFLPLLWPVAQGASASCVCTFRAPSRSLSPSFHPRVSVSAGLSPFPSLSSLSSPPPPDTALSRSQSWPLASSGCGGAAWPGGARPHGTPAPAPSSHVERWRSPLCLAWVQ